MPRAEDDIRAPAADAPAAGDLPAGAFSDEAGEEHREQRHAGMPEVEPRGGRQVVRHPGQQAIEDGIEEHPVLCSRR